MKHKTIESLIAQFMNENYPLLRFELIYDKNNATKEECYILVCKLSFDEKQCFINTPFAPFMFDINDKEQILSILHYKLEKAVLPMLNKAMLDYITGKAPIN